MKKYIVLVAFIAAVVSTPVSAAATKPSDITNLSNFYLTLPTNTKATPDTVRSLSNYEDKPYFYTEGNAIVFRTNVGGAHTKNSKYPRTELREMQNGKLASWNNKSGVHTLELTGAVQKLTPVKPHVVVAQVHDASDDVIMIRLEGKKLFVEGSSRDLGVLDSNYTLNKKYIVKIVATQGKFFVYYNNVLKVTYTKATSGLYFKAGCYLQSNPSKGDKASDYAQVALYLLQVTHK